MRNMLENLNLSLLSYWFKKNKCIEFLLVHVFFVCQAIWSYKLLFLNLNVIQIMNQQFLLPMPSVY